MTLQGGDLVNRPEIRPVHAQYRPADDRLVQRVAAGGAVLRERVGDPREAVRDHLRFVVGEPLVVVHLALQAGE
jgi:hypothetical protein